MVAIFPKTGIQPDDRRSRSDLWTRGPRPVEARPSRATKGANMDIKSVFPALAQLGIAIILVIAIMWAGLSYLTAAGG